MHSQSAQQQNRNQSGVINNEGNTMSINDSPAIASQSPAESIQMSRRRLLLGSAGAMASVSLLGPARPSRRAQNAAGLRSLEKRQ